MAGSGIGALEGGVFDGARFMGREGVFIGLGHKRRGVDRRWGQVP